MPVVMDMLSLRLIASAIIGSKQLNDVRLFKGLTMAKCDLCGNACKASEMAELLHQYQCDGVADICKDCKKWADKEKGLLLEEIPERLKVKIREKKSTPKKSFLGCLGRLVRA
jgi:hypothetical protein